MIEVSITYCILILNKIWFRHPAITAVNGSYNTHTYFKLLPHGTNV